MLELNIQPVDDVVNLPFSWYNVVTEACMKTLVAGATGFIGKVLLRRLSEPVILTRDPDEAAGKFPEARVFAWDPEHGKLPLEAFEGVGAVINLAGSNIAVRWSEDAKAEILHSRINATRTIVNAIANLKERPSVLVNASAVGYYGSRGDEELTEDSSPGDDFLASVCVRWEAAALKATELGVRVVTPRFGVVLGRSGGLLKRMLPPFKLGFGGKLGSGRQWTPVISVFDLADMIVFAIKDERVRGALNAVSPNPVTNADFTNTLAQVLGRPAFFTIPSFAVELIYGEFSQVVLASQRVLPKAALSLGFDFKHPILKVSLKDILE